MSIPIIFFMYRYLLGRHPNVLTKNCADKFFLTIGVTYTGRVSVHIYYLGPEIVKNCTVVFCSLIVGYATGEAHQRTETQILGQTARQPSQEPGQEMALSLLFWRRYAGSASRWRWKQQLSGGDQRQHRPASRRSSPYGVAGPAVLQSLAWSAAAPTAGRKSSPGRQPFAGPAAASFFLFRHIAGAAARPTAKQSQQQQHHIPGAAAVSALGRCGGGGKSWHSFRPAVAVSEPVGDAARLSRHCHAVQLGFESQQLPPVVAGRRRLPSSQCCRRRIPGRRRGDNYQPAQLSLALPRD